MNSNVDKVINFIFWTVWNAKPWKRVHNNVRFFRQANFQTCQNIRPIDFVFRCFVIVHLFSNHVLQLSKCFLNNSYIVLFSPSLSSSVSLCYLRSLRLKKSSEVLRPRSGRIFFFVAGRWRDEGWPRLIAFNCILKPALAERCRLSFLRRRPCRRRRAAAV